MAKKSEKEIKKNDKKNTTNKKKTQKKENYFKSIKKELKLVKWPTFKEVVKYTLATIIFCVVLCAFFILLNMLMAWIKGVIA